MKKINFKKIAKQILSTVKSIGSDADNDWKISFLLFVIVLIFSIAFHTKIFFSVESAKESGAALEAKKIELINNKALSKLLSQYDERAASYQAITTSTTVLVDPSR